MIWKTFVGCSVVACLMVAGCKDEVKACDGGVVGGGFSYTQPFVQQFAYQQQFVAPVQTFAYQQQFVQPYVQPIIVRQRAIVGHGFNRGFRRGFGVGGFARPGLNLQLGF